MYKLDKKIFPSKNGQTRAFWYRKETNDWNTIWAAFVEDEYGLTDLDFKEGDTVLDIGAYLGAVTLLLTTIRPDLRIYAFEPDANNFDLLRKNVRELDYKGEINIFKEAVWFEDDDTVRLYYGDNSENGKIHKFVGSQFILRSFYRKNLFYKVHTMSLSKIFEENHIISCRLIKMDVEGAEYGILKGAPKGVLEMIQEIRGEYHNIEPDRIKMPRQTLLDQTKGVFKDETGQPEKGNLGPFVFKKI